MSWPSWRLCCAHNQNMMSCSLWPGGGWQDQVGGLVGGLKLARSRACLPLRVEVERLSLSQDFLSALQQRLILVYTGKTRLARNLLQVRLGCISYLRTGFTVPSFMFVNGTCNVFMTLLLWQHYIEMIEIQLFHMLNDIELLWYSVQSVSLVKSWTHWPVVIIFSTVLSPFALCWFCYLHWWSLVSACWPCSCFHCSWPPLTFGCTKVMKNTLSVNVSVVCQPDVEFSAMTFFWQDVVRSWYSRLPSIVTNTEQLVSNAEECALACTDGKTRTDKHLLLLSFKTCVSALVRPATLTMSMCHLHFPLCI